MPASPRAVQMMADRSGRAMPTQAMAPRAAPVRPPMPAQAQVPVAASTGMGMRPGMKKGGKVRGVGVAKRGYGCGGKVKMR
jgi:hypothetical protein